ncbi:tautomerase family protein [Streptomyces sp. YS415]|uniref:tautomerase family protein n=1 Tax=Streptomyces sp. YS415 TaxID=2944806 RepID=UPI002021256F|nr:tautomerase family protein [Streptomyces sp. YS415]MCL7425724.1 tautomerase family protein [Streptomyces sp. YS415]
MPHVTIQHFPAALTAEQRFRLVEQLTAAVQEAFGVEERVVSIALVPVPPEDWDAQVYQPEIARRGGQLAKEPGY